jgi:hypothetical protein
MGPLEDLVANEDNTMLKEVPREWLLELQKIQEKTKQPSAILAGGSLRDLNMGGLVKDLDFFLEYYKGIEEDLADLYGVVGKMPYPLMYDGLPGIANVYEVSAPTVQYPIQIIAVLKYSVKRVINSFDINICKYWTDGVDYKYEGGNHGVILIDNIKEVRHLIKSVNRAARFKLKYPDLPIDFGMEIECLR